LQKLVNQLIGLGVVTQLIGIGIGIGIGIELTDAVAAKLLAESLMAKRPMESSLLISIPIPTPTPIALRPPMD
jgi:hypothetical protein